MPKKASIIGYGVVSDEEKDIFTQLVARNARNMCFEEYRVIFTEEDQVEQTVKNEVLSWEKS